MGQGRVRLNNVPDILGSVTEFAAGDAGGKTIIANGDLLVDILIGEIVSALGHGSDKDAYALAWLQVCYVIPGADDLGLEAQGDFPAVGRQMVGDGVLNDTQELLLGVGGPDGETV